MFLSLNYGTNSNRLFVQENCSQTKQGIFAGNKSSKFLQQF